ncbi:hypothetical protein KY290_021366 [Solanum tuberosum]|uniref:Integrase core domain containing protein n=1 Tax=Solanum tuberosum TaxID=4113 RepID=A0ABQ7V2B8_SOLTU|nr:hypothetical protein KY290_021366 [Solanum tuberosum]
MQSYTSMTLQHNPSSQGQDPPMSRQIDDHQRLIIEPEGFGFNARQETAKILPSSIGKFFNDAYLMWGEIPQTLSYNGVVPWPEVGKRKRTRARAREKITTSYIGSSVGARIVTRDMTPEPDPAKDPAKNDKVITPETGYHSNGTETRRKIQLNTLHSEVTEEVVENLQQINGTVAKEVVKDTGKDEKTDNPGYICLRRTEM